MKKLCTYCHKREIEENKKSRCLNCREYFRALASKRKERLLDSGLCTKCGKEKLSVGALCCDYCKKKASIGHKNLLFRRKINSLCTLCGNKLPPGWRMRACERCTSKRRKRVDAKVRPYRKHVEPCVCCGYLYSDIHHRNRNVQDNRKENLVSLCPNHHKLLHMGIISEADIDAALIR